jgi:hypothetical protein
MCAHFHNEAVILWVHLPARLSTERSYFVIIERTEGCFSFISPRRISPMTDAVKKTTKKVATTASKAKAPAKPGKKSAATNGHAKNGADIGVSRDQVAMLAHKYWAERGFRHGYDAEDWFRAEQELRAKAS